MRFVGPSEPHVLNVAGLWTEPMPAPTVVGIPRLSDRAVAVEICGRRYTRQRVDERPDAPMEALRDLVIRAARAEGTKNVFTLVYEGQP